MKFSIIVPVYNAERYLEECLNSLLNQNFTDYEIILINDGSTDRCSEICESYALKHNNIMVIHKENTGVSNSRNAGINVAKGDYIIFVDSDDTVEPHLLETISESLTSDDEQIVYCYNIKINNNIKSSIDYDIVDYIEISNFLELYNLSLFNLVWNKVFSRDILTNNNIYFNEDLSYGEDAYFCLDYIKFIKGFQIINKPLYNYRNDVSGSLSKSNVSVEINRQISNHFLDKLKEYNCFYGVNVLYYNRMVLDDLIREINLTCLANMKLKDAIKVIRGIMNREEYENSIKCIDPTKYNRYKIFALKNKCAWMYYLGFKVIAWYRLKCPTGER